ncbi:hypothetical protein [Escherichia coli]|uniref:hypothetical protein n=1 Tax=Escherichia coli TaxID=562 RepID=UPI0015C3AA1E|nr:hypothetical protein [Escherichia coli]
MKKREKIRRLACEGIKRKKTKTEGKCGRAGRGEKENEKKEKSCKKDIRVR